MTAKRKPSKGKKRGEGGGGMTPLPLEDDELRLIRTLSMRRYNPDLEVHYHRRLLLAEVDRLREENANLRAALTAHASDSLRRKP